MSIFMSMPAIKGDASDASHTGWIDVVSLKWGVNRRITAATSTMGDRESSNASMSELELVKLMDAATPKIFLESCCGIGKTIILELSKTGGGTGAEIYMQYTLKNAVVSGYHVEHRDLSKSRFAEQIRPVERIRISFVAAELRYTTYDQDGKPMTSTAVGFDTQTNRKS